MTMLDEIPDRSIRVVYLDPAWEYSSGHPRMDAGVHYNVAPSSSFGFLAEPLRRVIIPFDSCMFMWTTGPMIPEALALMATLGVTYKTMAYTWLKMTIPGTAVTFGGGFYTRSATEFVLFGVWGKSPQRKNRGVRQAVFYPEDSGDTLVAPRSPIHSRKPDEVRTRIETLYDGPYLELFATDPRPHWWAWGDSLPGGFQRPNET